MKVSYIIYKVILKNIDKIFILFFLLNYLALQEKRDSKKIIKL